jgi:hypothetical protein
VMRQRISSQPLQGLHAGDARQLNIH